MIYIEKYQTSEHLHQSCSVLALAGIHYGNFYTTLSVDVLC